jgi:hypothetical protein
VYGFAVRARYGGRATIGRKMIRVPPNTFAPTIKPLEVFWQIGFTWIYDFHTGHGMVFRRDQAPETSPPGLEHLLSEQEVRSDTTASPNVHARSIQP